MARDFSGTISRLGEANLALTVTRTAAGTTLKGRYTPGATSTVTLAVGTFIVQPMGARDLLRLPEGLRTSEAKKLWSTVELKVEPDPDVVTYGGRSYQVHALTDWSYAAGYFEYGLVKAEA